jgi:hypothetical protein
MIHFLSNELNMFPEGDPQRSSPHQQRNRKIKPLPKRSRYGSGKSTLPSDSEGATYQNPADHSTGLAIHSAFTMGREMVDRTDSTTPSPSHDNPQRREGLVDRTPPDNGSQPSMVSANPPVSSFTFRPSMTPRTSNSVERGQTAGLQQTLRNLTLTELGNPASTFTAEAPLGGQYNIRDEPAPNELFYSQPFQSTLKAGMKIANDAVDGLTTLRHRMNNQGLRIFQETAETLKAYQSSGKRTIAVLGDSGQGERTLQVLRANHSLLICHS